MNWCKPAISLFWAIFLKEPSGWTCKLCLLNAGLTKSSRHGGSPATCSTPLLWFSCLYMMEENTRKFCLHNTLQKLYEWSPPGWYLIAYRLKWFISHPKRGKERNLANATLIRLGSAWKMQLIHSLNVWTKEGVLSPPESAGYEDG